MIPTGSFFIAFPMKSNVVEKVNLIVVCTNDKCQCGTVYSQYKQCKEKSVIKLHASTWNDNSNSGWSMVMNN